MPKAKINNIEIEYETIGDPTSKPLLLIAGLGSQLLAWPDEMCKNLANRGFFVIRFDNRDIGLSTKLKNTGMPNFMEISAAHACGEKPEVPYTLEDMADDAIGVLDTLNIDKAHICGASMGGMIAQVIAYRHPTRVSTLTIIMSTTGNPTLPPGKPEIMAAFFAPVPSEREAYIEEMIKRDSLIYGKFPFDEKQSRDYRTKEYDRSYYPEGPARQMAAMAVPGNTQPKISAIQAPTLVIHGSEDPFNSIEAGKEIANTIPGAELLILDGMGHSFPREIIPRIIDAIVANNIKAGN
ncbi:MAG: alpha/beta hydrolase [Candidatus Lokiarchaeota archaeon]|nr:alpha/beta hydrolase [Candidatus Lokiarchaeota archaeon]